MKNALFIPIIIFCLMAFRGAYEPAQTPGENIADYFMPSLEKKTITILNQKTGESSNLFYEQQILETGLKGKYILEKKNYMIDSQYGTVKIAHSRILFTCTDSTIKKEEETIQNLLHPKPETREVSGYLLKLPKPGQKIQWKETDPEDGTVTTYTAYFKTENGKKMLVLESYIPDEGWGTSSDYYEKNVGYVKTYINGRLYSKVME